ncbi:DUF1559 domain-containing protein [Novipirellula rosea]|uniref:DUF1559 domain-containing protein n=1 Tax=Novipirellula rosea TaxID=1031540 RepID=A0ABP8MKI1_9BACT
MLSNRSNTSAPTKRASAAFTLVEMLVVISIIGVLATLMLPAINRARAAARGTQCQSNLKQFGVGLTSRTVTAPDSTFCTGDFNYERDGVPTEFGWVADLVDRGVLVSEMRCPGNPAMASTAIQQLLTMDISEINLSKYAGCTPCVDCLSSRRLGSEPFEDAMGDRVMNIAREIDEKSVNDLAGRANLVDRRLVQKGYNTNYAGTWFLFRTEFTFDDNGNPSINEKGCSNAIASASSEFTQLINDTRGRYKTRGPLSTNRVDAGKAPASTIPLLCDAAAIGFLELGVGETIPDSALYATSMVGQPVAINNGSDWSLLEVPKLPSGTPREGVSGWLRVWNHKTRQDYRGMAPLHLGVAYVLMADGSIRAIGDKNGDGYINNGFTQHPDYWTSSDVEAPEIMLSSYYSLNSKGSEN